MNKKQLYEKLNQTSTELERLQHDLFAVEHTDILLYPENFTELTAAASLRSERITCTLRQLACQVPGYRMTYLAQAAQAQGIAVSDQDDILSVTLPGLLPKRQVGVRNDFLMEPLFYALSQHAMSHPIKRYQRSTVCFFHIYDSNIHPYIRDHDNVECKQVLDAVSLFFLPDDSGAYCDIYHTSRIGATDKTQIFILSSEIFPTWLAAQNPMQKHIGF